jgi:hypothetical protein
MKRVLIEHSIRMIMLRLSAPYQCGAEPETSRDVLTRRYNLQLSLKHEICATFTLLLNRRDLLYLLSSFS